MGKLQLPAMQGLPINAIHVAAIKAVPGKGVADMGKMCPDLMGSSGLQRDRKKGVAGQSFLYSIMGYGSLSRFIHLAANFVTGDPQKRRIDRTGIFLNLSLHNRIINLLHAGR